MKYLFFFVVTLLAGATPFSGTGKALASEQVPPPTVIKAVSALFPTIAAVSEESGIVIVEVTVGADGAVLDARATEGHKLFRGVAERSAKRWIFNSLTGEHAVRTVRLTFIFKFVPKRKATPEELLPVFMPLYGVEIRGTKPDYIYNNSVGGAHIQRKPHAMTPTDERCLVWRSKVDSTLMLPKDVPGVDEKDQQRVMEGIDCLLRLEGNINKANFSGVTKPYVSQLFKPATVEVGALYYISYLFTEKWAHADAIALVDNKKEPNASKMVHRAYVAYREWFQHVKKIGLADARKKQLDPLKGKDIRWY